jgi:asparagine synthase (glutamine-hydrolysing)
MCGILGHIGERDFTQAEFERANNLLEHRGPDEQGVWSECEGKIFFGHRRLSILELSEKGSQPKVSRSGRYTITFNGEIYNHLELRSFLESSFGISHSLWDGNSDTETVLQAIDCLGVEEAIASLTGMFAFGVWDNLEKTFYLVRDRIGEKPLYFCSLAGKFYFSSELKAIKALSKNKLEVCKDSLGLYFKHNYIPAPYCIYQDSFKLMPGNFFKASLQDVTSNRLSDCNSYEDFRDLGFIKEYWSLKESYNKSINRKFESKEESVYEIEKSLSEAIKKQQISDVAIGTFLSGGIDSSLVTAIMQKQNTQKIKTFTIGFQEKEFDESCHAKKIADHLKTEHTEHVISMGDALKIIPNLPTMYDEPFADSSQIPTHLVSAITKDHVTVALSGDGGDEFFGGYNRHFRIPQIYNYFSKIPTSLLKPLGSLLGHTYSISPQLTKLIASIVVGPSPQIGDKIERLSERLKFSKTPEQLYKSFVSEWNDIPSLVLGSKDIDIFVNLDKETPSFDSAEEKIMYLDSMTYLPDDIMAKVDRASMFTSLETRAPFLDHNLIEQSFRVPISHKIANGEGKIVLKEILSKYINPELFLRPKQGFGIPVADWLRGPLKKNFEELTSRELILSQGYLNYDLVNLKWNQHLKGTHNWSHSLWSVYMFQLWLEKN